MKHIFESIIVPASVLIPIGAGLTKAVHQNPPSKSILFYLIFAAVADVAEQILGLHHINNLPLLHLYTLVEYLFILRFFQSVVINPKARTVISILLISFPFFSIFNFLFLQDIHGYNSYPRSIAALIITGLCMYYFIQYNEQENYRVWTTVALNWIVTGLLIYFSSALIYFAFLNFIAQYASDRVYFIFGGIHAALVLLMYLLIAVGFTRVRNE